MDWSQIKELMVLAFMIYMIVLGHKLKIDSNIINNMKGYMQYAKDVLEMGKKIFNPDDINNYITRKTEEIEAENNKKINDLSIKVLALQRITTKKNNQLNEVVKVAEDSQEMMKFLSQIAERAVACAVVLQIIHKDFVTLEEQGLFNDDIGKSVKGKMTKDMKDILKIAEGMKKNSES